MPCRASTGKKATSISSRAMGSTAWRKASSASSISLMVDSSRQCQKFRSPAWNTLTPARSTRKETPRSVESKAFTCTRGDRVRASPGAMRLPRVPMGISAETI